MINKKTIATALLAMTTLLAGAKDVRVSSFKAKGDGVTLNTQQLQRAIDACAKSGGGRVIFDTGSYLSGGLELRSNVYLYLPEGAELQGSARYTEDYPRRAFLYAEQVEHAGIIGGGTVNGNGGHPDVLAQGFVVNDSKRPNLIFFKDCKDMRLTDVHLKEAGSWTVHLFRVDGITIDRIHLRCLAQGNNDGIDVDARNVIISNSYIEAEDDGICLKSDDPAFMPENIVVSNCVIASNCNPIKFGTASKAGFRNVNITNCAITRTTESHIWDWSKEYDAVAKGTLTGLAGIAIESVDGGIIEHVNISNITMEGVITPIFIVLNHRKGTTGQVRDIHINNVTAKAEGTIPCLITGSPRTRVHDIVLRDIRVEHEGGQPAFNERLGESNGYPENRMFGRKNPAGGLYVRHAERITIDNFVVNYRRQDQRPAVVLDDVHHFEAAHLRQDGRAPHLYMLQGDCDDIAINGEKVNPNAPLTSK